MIYVLCILLFAIGVVAGLFIERGRLNRGVPNIGRLDLNFAMTAEEPLQLHITDDIDMEHPPKEVRLMLTIEK